jgi:hypothetical protein
MVKRVMGCLLVLAFSVPTARAQQGHPLEGTWQGLWGETPDERNFLTLILRWNGDNIVGGVNPGPNAGSIRSVQLDSSTWTVQLDLDVPDRVSGESVRVMAEGRLLDIGSPKRMLRGILLNGNPDSYFRISRE